MGQNRIAWNSPLVSESMEVYFTFSILTANVHDLLKRILFLSIQAQVKPQYYSTIPPDFLTLFGSYPILASPVPRFSCVRSSFFSFAVFLLSVFERGASRLFRFRVVVLNFLTFFIPRSAVIVKLKSMNKTLRSEERRRIW